MEAYDRQASEMQNMLKDEDDERERQQEERKDMEVMQARMQDMTLREPREAVYFRKSAENHRTRHDQLTDQALAEMKRKDKERCEDGSKGLGRTIRKIKTGFARPLLYVGKKEEQEGGGTRMRYYTKPKEVDAQVRKEWKSIYDGNMGSDHEAHVESFMQKYGEYIYRQEEEHWGNYGRAGCRSIPRYGEDGGWRGWMGTCFDHVIQLRCMRACRI